jgi:hypothetical protein
VAAKKMLQPDHTVRLQDEDSCSVTSSYPFLFDKFIESTLLLLLMLFHQYTRNIFNILKSTCNVYNRLHTNGIIRLSLQY